MCLKVDLLKIVCTLVKGLPGLANWRRLITSSKRTWQHEARSIWEKWRGQHLCAIFRHAQIHGTTGTMPPRTASSFVSKRHTSMAFAEPRSRDAPSINSIKVISPSPLSRNLRFCFELRNVPCEKTPTLMSTKYEPCLKIFQMFAASCNQRSQIGWANHGIPVQVGPSKISALATSCHKAQSTYFCMNFTNKIQMLTPPFGNKICIANLARCWTNLENSCKLIAPSPLASIVWNNFLTFLVYAWMSCKGHNSPDRWSYIK